MYHSFFIHSSINGHLGCFHVLAIRNRAALGNMGLFHFWFPQDTCLVVGSLGLMVVLFLVFKEIFILSSMLLNLYSEIFIMAIPW